MIFGICHEVYRGELRMLGKIVLVTIAMTNWHIRRHPLRRPDGELVEQSDSDHAGEEWELDESLPPLWRLNRKKWLAISDKTLDNASLDRRITIYQTK
jgi:hypothetical protein